jgi:hypothetical protein
MFIPYFYFKAGDIQILQPQNNKTNFEYEIEVDNDYVYIKSINRPESRTETLYLNGDHVQTKYNMLKLGKTGDKFIKAIKIINEENSNV